MWNSTRSLKLSKICTRFMIVGVFVCGALLPKMMSAYMEVSSTYDNFSEIMPLMILLYVCCIPALVALFALDRLLTNIGNEKIFIEKNIKYLRVISWCCFAVGTILILGTYYYLILILVAIVASFFGLIIRVVKNVIQEAVCLKEENDFTI